MTKPRIKIARSLYLLIAMAECGRFCNHRTHIYPAGFVDIMSSKLDVCRCEHMLPLAAGCSHPARFSQHIHDVKIAFAQSANA